MINGFGKNGAICGAVDSGDFDQIYVKNQVNITITSSTFPFLGGIFGLALVTSPKNLTLNNSYSKAKLNSPTNPTGGLIGLVGSSQTFIYNSYADSTFSSASGNLIGRIISGAGVTLNNTYYNNENSYPPIANNLGMLNGSATGLNSIDLYNNISNKFSELIWCKGHLLIGIKFSNLNLLFFLIFFFLKKEYNYTQDCFTLPPTTLTPSTTEPSTLTPSTTEPSTLTPSTLIPSTTEPSTLTPSTTEPSTLTPSTTEPSTLTPSTLIPITEASTLTPSTTPSNSCAFDVLNCENCNKNTTFSNSGNFTVLCVQIGGQWRWLFYNSSSPNNTIFNDKQLVVENQLFIQGNFSQTKNGEIIFFVSNNFSSSSLLNVSGCVSLQGSIIVVLESQPDEGSSLLQIISYNCSTLVNQSNYQLQVQANYENISCHKLSYSQNNQQNSLSLSLNVKGCGNYKALIISLSVGIPVALILISLFSIKMARVYMQKDIDSFIKKQSPVPLDNLDFQSNESFRDRNNTQWKDFKNI